MGTSSFIGINRVLWGTREKETEMREIERAVPWGLVEDIGVGEGEAMMARTSGSMQRRRWSSRRLQPLLLIGLGKEVGQLLWR
jgi:hypothetical protein